MIQAKNITKTFPIGNSLANGREVLKGIDLEIGKGEIAAIVGASGAGKSTLLHILGTLDRPTSGQVLYENLDVFAFGDDRLSAFRNQHIGFVFQFHHLLPEFNVFENVAMPALIRGKKLTDVRHRVHELLKSVGVDDRALSRPNSLSGGEQQRVAVARALMNEPKVVLADEPSGNLDTKNALQLHELIWELSRRLEQTFIIVTHNEAFANRADEVLRIVDGQVAGKKIRDKS
ncbi:MAG: ABC transporter ATP-binding protein [Ignavibacteriae bacterium]|nr:ABC transporter ATP-binding protein [Ignavibacteriota bacterium]